VPEGELMVGHASERPRRRRSEVEDRPKKEEIEEVEEIDVQEPTPEESRKPREPRETRESDDAVKDRLRKAIDDLEVQERREETVSQRMERALEGIDEPEKIPRSTESRLRDAIDDLEDDTEAEQQVDDTRPPDVGTNPERPTAVNDTEPELPKATCGEVHPRGDDVNDGRVRLESMEDVDEALENYPEIELRKDFGEKYDRTKIYYEEKEKGEIPKKPELVYDLESREVRRKYEDETGGPPIVRIESMKDVDDLREKYSGQISESKLAYEKAPTYFEIRNERGKSQHQLAQEYGYSQSKISNIRRGIETNLIKELRMKEEERIIQEWCDSRKQSESSDSTKDIEKSELNIQDSSLHKIQEKTIRESFREIQESKDISRTTLEDAIEKMMPTSSEIKNRVRMANLSESGLTPDELGKVREVLNSNRPEIQDTLKHRTNLEKVRIGMVNDKLYIWTPDLTPNDMVNAWHNQYFYFNNRDLAKIADESGSRLDLGNSRRERLRNLNDLMKEMVNDGASSDIIKIDGNRSRVPGEALHIQCDVLGIKNKDLEGRVRKVTGINGHGGIENPKFPKGQKLEAWRAGLIGAALSDCHIRPDGIVEYYEENLERLNRFKESLKEIGDFTNEPSYLPHSHIYRLKLPSPYGRALNVWEVPSGDKTIQNPGLPSDYRNWSPESKCKYSSEMTSEESNISSGRCSWPRSNVVKAGEKKADTYGFKERISKKEIDLIKDKGKSYSGDFEGERTIPYGLIDDLKNDEDSSVGEVARELEKTIHRNRNHLIDDEKQLHADIGVDIAVYPKEITYYEEYNSSWAAVSSESS